MSGILEIIKAIIQVIPLLLELVKIIKGQPTIVVHEAKEAAKKAARDRCDLSGGVGCGSEIKK